MSNVGKAGNVLSSMRRAAILSLLAVFLAGRRAEATEPTWKLLAAPPCGYPVTALATDPLDLDTLYAGSCGLFRLRTADPAWPAEAIYTFPVIVVTVSPTVPRTFYLITWSSPDPLRGLIHRDLVQSVDGGATWFGLLNSIYSVTVDPANPLTAYAAASPSFDYPNTGVYKTEDAGLHWTNTTSGVTSVTALAIDTTDSRILYASADQSFVKSTDAGATWFPIARNVTAYSMAVDPTSPSTIYAGGATGVLRTTDAGNHWSFFPIGGYTSGTLAVDPLSRALFVATDQGVLRSDDQGESWTAFGQGLTGLPVSALAISSSHTLYAGTQSGVFAIPLLSRAAPRRLLSTVAPRPSTGAAPR